MSRSFSFFCHPRESGDLVEPRHSLHSILKAEMKCAGVTHAQLAERLQDMGIDGKEANISNKQTGGNFSTAFMIQCLEAIGPSELQL